MQVKLAAVLRSLITVAETLRVTMHQRDPDTGEILIDLKSTDAYLKVLTQICNTYKLDSTKLLFAGGEQGAGAAEKQGTGLQAAGI